MTTPSLPASWDREGWLRHADRLLLAMRPHATPGKARFRLPGGHSGLGSDVDGLEAFARSFLMAGFRLAGERGQDPHGFADWYAEGLATGTDPSSPERWVRLDEHPQAKVEAAPLALILDMTRPWIWDRLDPAVQVRVIDYLAPAVGDDTYPRINWVWFRLVVQTFLRSVGGPHNLDEMTADLATHDTFFRPGGWLADGPHRAFDHYNGWALHLFPTLWARMAGAADLAESRRERDTGQLDRFLQDAIRLVGSDGSPLLQGRSLVYRFAAAAPFWVGALAEAPSVGPGQARRAASLILQHFASRGAPNSDGLLDLGWFDAWPQLAQSYSGPGSPYWAGLGMLGLALPGDHPVWTAPGEPLPSETADFLTVAEAPGWIISGTVADGVVRVINHGTDHAHPGAAGGDSPYYARLGYSTATLPPLDGDSWHNPLDNSVVLLDRDGNASHRTGMEVLALRIDDDHDAGPLAVAASTTRAQWLVPHHNQSDHGQGLVGDATPAGQILTVSLVRGPVEARLARVDAPSAGARRIRIGGWPLSENAAGRLASRVTPLTPGAEVRLDTRTGASPLGEHTRTPYLVADVHDGTWTGAAVELSGQRDPGAVDILIQEEAGVARFTCTWPDGVRTTTTIATDSSRATLPGRTNPSGPEPGRTKKESE